MRQSSIHRGNEVSSLWCSFEGRLYRCDGGPQEGLAARKELEPQNHDYPRNTGSDANLFDVGSTSIARLNFLGWEATGLTGWPSRVGTLDLQLIITAVSTVSTLMTIKKAKPERTALPIN